MHLYNTTKGRLAKIIIQSSNYCVSSNPHDCDIVLCQLQNNPNIRGVAPLLSQAETMQQQLIKFERIYLRVTAHSICRIEFCVQLNTILFFLYILLFRATRLNVYSIPLVNCLLLCVCVCAWIRMGRISI